MNNDLEITNLIHGRVILYKLFTTYLLTFDLLYDHNQNFKITILALVDK